MISILNYIDCILVVVEESTSEEESSEEECDGGSLPYWTFCKLCDIHFGSERAFVTHLRGVSHIQLVLERKKKRHPERYQEETDRQMAAINDDVRPSSFI